MSTRNRTLRGVVPSSLVVGAMLGGATAWSQDRPGAPRPPAGGDAAQQQPDQNELVLRTQFLEAIQSAKWREAVDAFVKLRKVAPAVLQEKRFVFEYANAQYNCKETAQASTTLDHLLSELQDNPIKGLFLQATIKAEDSAKVAKNDEEKTERERDKDLCKDLLVSAARAGQFVLRDISSADGKKAFGFLLTDPGFILRVMNASNEFQIASTVPRNPFASPLRRPVDGDELPPDDDKLTGITQRQIQLEEEIDNLFKEILVLAEQKQVEELVVKFTQLRAIMNEYQQIGTQEVKKKLEKWGDKLRDLGEVRLSIQLQVFISEGNQYLRAMAEAIRNDEYDAALDQFKQIEELCEQMKAEEREVFHRNAEALYLRGKALADRAKRLKRISEFDLIITGVVVAAPDGKEPDKAIIADKAGHDHIYQEGDTVLDLTTDEEIEGLRIVEIVRSTVRFRYEDTEFVRELKPQPQ